MLASFCGYAGRFVSGVVGNSRRHVFSCRGSFIFLSCLSSTSFLLPVSLEDSSAWIQPYISFVFPVDSSAWIQPCISFLFPVSLEDSSAWIQPRISFLYSVSLEDSSAWIEPCISLKVSISRLFGRQLGMNTTFMSFLFPVSQEDRAVWIQPCWLYRKTSIQINKQIILRNHVTITGENVELMFN